MHPYVRTLKQVFENHADPLKAAPMKRYMRDQFEYLGIKSPLQAELHRNFIREHGLPPLKDLDRISRDLWALPQREFQYCASSMLGRLEAQLTPQILPTVEYMITTKSWWDTVDTLASHTVGGLFKKFPKLKSVNLRKWRRSKNLWLRRTTLLFQLGYKQDTDFDLLCELIRENLGSEEFFINKAIGWALRQYAWTNPRAVRKFVEATKELHPLSQREALKNIGE
jgi:3-methyladenine DNA glycosylase AlkD